MSNVIEITLKKTGAPQQAPNANVVSVANMAPTISSILNNDSNEVTIVSEYNLNSAQVPRSARNEVSIMKLVPPLIAATITPVPAPGQVPSQTQQDRVIRDDLVVLQVQDGRGGGEPETLDLSIKKPRDLAPPMHPKHPQPPVSHRSEQQSPYMGYHQHREERKSPAVYVSAVPPRVQPKLPSPKPANLKTGSITQGTPIINQPRFEGLLRQITPESKMGSITQGTPIHVPHMQQDKRMYDYYNKRQSVTQPPPPQSGGYPPPQYRQPPAAVYSVDQQLSSRQIIMNDYITSQQMLGRRAAASDKAAAVAAAAQYYARTPPPSQQPPQMPPSSIAAQQQQQQQQRQGVIQRHNTQQPQQQQQQQQVSGGVRPHYPPGHEALGSLVDVAVQQPSLPVPPSATHEGLGKTMVDNLMEQPRRFQMMEQHQQQLRQQQQQRIEAERRFHQQQQQQQQQQQIRHQQQVPRSDSSTLTAASLIDAIITHQINQTAEGGQSVPNSREPARASDRLFQSFTREQAAAALVQQQQQQAAQQQQDNGERPPSVISVDLDGDTANSKSLTIKELADTVIAHDFGAAAAAARQSAACGPTYYHHPHHDAWKRHVQQKEQEGKRSITPHDERQIIRIAQAQKYHVEPVSPPESNHWSEQNYRRYQQQQQLQQQQQQQQQQQSHNMSALDYVKNRIVEVMRTEDDKKEVQDGVNMHDKDRSDSPGDMVIDEEKHESEQQHQQPPTGAYGSYSYMTHKQSDNAGVNDAARNVEPKPLLSAQYEPLSDED
ncbi:mediator of RNA polymerase II transcription subunit 15-like isoform X1 [Agrilus planipennis]|uniref:Mediator of RNA polymerase II transcription subunit 15-like isoform X1 n=1 Tax=Agrilus planipennis TaxID=224129 RepID=A0A7F5RGQ2_AGRPL|nr:mediator of RNA polymerase II transcription subunit 15-like isoform X1 [Agrilus planipennis]